MNQEKIIASGIKHFTFVNEDGTSTGRSVDFSPADQNFAEDLYCLASKIDAIHEAKLKEYTQAEDLLAKFEIGRAEDQKAREAVDAIFGEGFSGDVFKVRLFTLVDGLTVVERFLLSLLDEMDESVTASIASRNTQIKKYTDKYSKYHK